MQYNTVYIIQYNVAAIQDAAAAIQYDAAAIQYDAAAIQDDAAAIQDAAAAIQYNAAAIQYDAATIQYDAAALQDDAAAIQDNRAGWLRLFDDFLLTFILITAISSNPYSTSHLFCPRSPHPFVSEVIEGVHQHQTPPLHGDERGAMPPPPCCCGLTEETRKRGHQHTTAQLSQPEICL